MGQKNKSLSDRIKRIDKSLVEYFGIPPRKKDLPDSVDMIIATILSQNTNDNNSYKAYQNLKKRYKSWDNLLSARRTSIEKEIRVAGLAVQKSKAIKEFITNLFNKKNKISLEHIVQMQDNEAIEELTKFKGVGVKTASCVLLFAEGRNICPVDTHVHRTLNRIGVVNAATPDKTFYKINEKFPLKIAHQFHTNLIRLGREVCKSQNPSCGICPLIRVCNYSDKVETNDRKSETKDFMLLDSV
ncbi:MAG: endonuclease III [Bacteroidota bacterium]